MVQVLIEKDWISFGHKFADRCDQLDGDPKEVSPVFTQFLECVWQLTEQFPQVGVCARILRIPHSNRE